MGIVRLALRHPYTVAVSVLALVVLGLFTLPRLAVDLLPTFETPAVQIVTLYPGMAPEVVERDIMSRLQRWTGQSVGIERQEAKAMLGVCVVKDFFREDVDPNTAMSQVTSLAVSDMFYLPPGTLPPMVMPFDPTASVPLCLLSISSPTMSEKELYEAAYFEMRNRLQSISGVIAPAVYGGVLRRILAYVDRDRLEARNLSPMDVTRAIQRANPFVPTGSAKLGDRDYIVLSNAMVERVEELNDVPIRIDRQAPVFLRDVARAEDTHQIQSNIVRINGRRQVYVPVYRQPGASSLGIVEEVKKHLPRMRQRVLAFNPGAGDMRLDVVMDQSEGIRGTIRSLRNSAILGAILVAAVVWLFLRDRRATLLVLSAVPLAMLGALLGLSITGHSLNAMTLGGLSLAVGILVDQAIVVVEEIHRRLARGEDVQEAALRGAGEVAVPVTVSTLTFLVVLFPVVFLSGMAHFLFAPLAVAVTLAAACSLALALTYLPAAAARFLRPASPRPRPSPSGEEPREPGEPANPQASPEPGGSAPRERGLVAGYGRIVAAIVRRKGLVLGLSLLLLAAAVAGFTRLGTELFPTIDAGQFTILVRAPAGTRLEETEKRVAGIEEAVQDELGRADPRLADPASDLRLLVSNLGVLYDWPAAYTPNTGPMDAFLLVQLKADRKRSAQEAARALRERLPREFPGIDFAFDTGGMLTAALNFGLPSPLDLQIRGSGDLAVHHAFARAIAGEARHVPGAVDVRIAQPLDHPAVEIEVDRTKAATLGLTQEEVIQNVAAALNSSVNFAPSFWISPVSGNHYLLGTQYPESAIRSFETLENVPLTGAKTRGPVLLQDVARLRRTTTPVVVQHQNITRTVDVYVNADGRDVGSVARDLEARLAASPRLEELRREHPGFRILPLGEVASMRESFGQFAAGAALAAILIYLVLVAQFRSFVVPAVILAAVPLGLVGVVGMLLATGTNLGIPSFMGLILMVGIVVEYSILLVDRAVRLQREGRPIAEAIVEAARSRLRPVLMTSLTTALALVPMAVGIGRGGEANIPLARSIIGAVLGGTALTLLVVPALHAWLARGIRRDPA